MNVQENAFEKDEISRINDKITQGILSFQSWKSAIFLTTFGLLALIF